MSWSISVMKNTVEFDLETARKIHDAMLEHDDGGWGWEEGEAFEEGSSPVEKQWDRKTRDYTDKATFHFFCDHMEHMDWLWAITPEVSKLVPDGQVTFSDTEGDQRGEYWSYIFKDGVMTQKKGKLVDLLP